MVIKSILKNAEVIKVANVKKLAIGILLLQLEMYNVYVFNLKVVYIY